MTDSSKIKPTHTQRVTLVYIRQSSPTLVEHNRESTARQYALADRACQLGWSREQVIIIDEDLGLSGSSVGKRSGFTRLTNEVALAHGSTAASATKRHGLVDAKAPFGSPEHVLKYLARYLRTG